MNKINSYIDDLFNNLIHNGLDYMTGYSNNSVEFEKNGVYYLIVYNNSPYNPTNEYHFNYLIDEEVWPCAEHFELFIKNQPYYLPKMSESETKYFKEKIENLVTQFRINQLRKGIKDFDD